MIQRCVFVSYLAIVDYDEVVMSIVNNLDHEARSA
jgi:hypothetical protein